MAEPLPSAERIPAGRMTLSPAVRHGLWALLAFVVLTVVFTWPLVLRMPQAVVGEFGDNMHFVWMVGWFEQALLEQGISPYFAPQLNYPQGWELARSEIPTTLVLAGLPGSVIGQPVLGYNLAVLSSFVLSSLAAYICVFKLTNDPWAAFVAGAAYGLTPFRIAHFRAGHLNVLATMWLPLILLGLIKILSDRRASRWYGVATGVAFGLLAHSSMYATYLTALVCGFAVLGYLVIAHRRLPPMRDLGKQLAAALAAGGPLLATGLWPYLSLASGGRLPERDVFSVTGGSASLSDYLLPSTDHFLWGSWISDSFSRDSWIEGSLYIGLAIAGLAGLALWRRRQLEMPRAAFLLLALVAVAGLVISLGTHLHWNEQVVRLSLPEIVQARMGQDSISIRLPGYYLYQGLPYFDRLRTFKRAGVLVLGTAIILAGLGLSYWRRASPGRALPLAALALVLFEFYPGPFETFSVVEPRPVDVWLREQPGDGAVAEFPAELMTDQLHVYYTLENDKPYLGGFFNAFPPEQYLRTAPVLSNFPSARSVGLLTELRVAYVVVHLPHAVEAETTSALLGTYGWYETWYGGGTAVFQRAERR